jgi:hypothetical protein
MQKQLFIFYFLCININCFSIEISKLNVFNIFLKPYQNIFIQRQPLTSANKKLWDMSMNTVTNFVTSTSNYNPILTKTMKSVEQIGQECLSNLENIRGIAGFLKTLPKNEKNGYKREIEHQLNELLTRLYFANNEIKNSLKNQSQENARIALQSSINYIKNTVVSSILEELNKI